MQNTSSSHQSPLIEIETNRFEDHNKLFGIRQEWIVFWVSFLVTFAIYTFTLAPSVVLRDSGELVTAADHFGVPHPPGYPLLTLLSYMFIHIVPFGNVAWKVNWFNALCSSLAVGFVSYLICTSGRILTSNLISTLQEKSQQTFSRAIGFCSITGGLVLALSHAMWSQSVVAEKYALNSLLMSLILVFLYKWFLEPEKYRYISLAAFFFGLGMTAHQTLLFIFPAVVAAVYFKTTSFIPDTYSHYKKISTIKNFPDLILDTIKRLFYCGFIQDTFFKSFFIFSLLLINTSFSVFAILSRDLQLLDICLRWHIVSIPLIILLTSYKKPFTTEYLIFVGLAVICFLITLFGALVIQTPDFARFSGPVDVTKLVEESINAKVLCLSLTSLILAFGSCAFFFSREKASRFIPILLLASWAGLSFYGYLSIASKTNPPMNWGYASTPQGFFHAINRGQYENNLANTIKSVLGPAFFVKAVVDNTPSKTTTQQLLGVAEGISSFAKKLKLYCIDLLQNFTVYIFVISLLSLFYIRKIPRASWSWIFFLVVSFLFMSVALTYMVGGDMDRQARWINRVFFIPSHIIYSFAIGYGLMCGTYYLFQKNWFFPPALLILLTIPVVFSKHYPQDKFNWELSEQRDHDFGWQYGYDMLINCEPNSFIFGGTDPGRFVPTYMIFAESRQNPSWKMDQLANPKRKEFDRRDMYIVTQNALADETYMNYIRDHYGFSRPLNYSDFEKKHLDRATMYPKEAMWIPERIDGERAFKQYVDLARTNPAAAPGIRVSPDGRVSIAGIEGVFAINGLLAQLIFEKNKNRIKFYVEESFPLPWMYPYLQPFGLIMELNKDPLKEIPDEVMAKDRIYWDAYTKKLMDNPAYLRDEDARKAFSKLRVSIGGLYFWRALNEPNLEKRKKYLIEAEYALRQSIELCPFSTESVFRYVDMLAKGERYEEAIKELQILMKEDPLNDKIGENMKIMQNQLTLLNNQKQLELFIAQNPGSIQAYVQLLQSILARGRTDIFEVKADEIMKRGSVPPEVYNQIGQMYLNYQQVDKAKRIFLEYTKRNSTNSVTWYNLALLQSLTGETNQALDSLENAVKYDPTFSAAAVGEQRFTPLKASPRFNSIVNSPAKTKPLPVKKN